MFRHERPQKGRQRQFNQLGIENIGHKDPLIDAEVIAFGYFFIKTIGLSSIKVCLNSLGDNESRQNYLQALKEYLQPYSQELCHDCQERLAKNPLRILDTKNPDMQQLVEAAPKLLDYLKEDSLAFLRRMEELLSIAGVDYTINPRLVRGLDYYNHTVYDRKRPIETTTPKTLPSETKLSSSNSKPSILIESRFI